MRERAGETMQGQRGGRRRIMPRISEDGAIVVRVDHAGPPAPSPSACPFYGMMGHRLGVFMGPPGGSNACGLAHAHAPCRMEITGRAPDWESCEARNPLGDDAALAAVAHYAVHPGAEADPSGAGIPVVEWFARVVGRPPRTN